jgi:eukaryotic-like serine/threonine-protein kinase
MILMQLDGAPAALSGTPAGRQSGEAMPEASQKQIGELAVQQGLISAEQLSEALQEFSVRRVAGSHLPLGEVLVELELITRAQLDALLEAQGGKKAPRQQIPGFELVRKLGEGGMGATYLARQVSMDRLVALKILRKKFSEQGDFIARFQREARLAGSLNHPNIVQAMDVGESSGFHYLVMEYVEGRNLVEIMPEDGGMNEGRALDFTLQIAGALAFAGEQGIIHRDIKPDNILVTAENAAKLCDFGLAKQTAEDSSLTQTGMAMGTPHYISPEQARGSASMDIRGDIYSLGATLYHLVTGQTPYQGPTAAVVMTKHLNEQLPWPQDVNPEVTENCSRVITKMMAKDPNDRYMKPADLISDLQDVIAGKSPKLASLGKGRSSVARRGAVPVRPRTGRGRGKRHQTARMKSANRTSATESVRIGSGSGSAKALYAAGAAVLLGAVLGLWVLTRSGKEEVPPPVPVSGVEAAASRAWSREVQPLVGSDIKASEAQALGAALISFSAAHGGTSFAAQRSDEIKRLRALAKTAIDKANQGVEDMFKYALAYWRKHPQDYDGAIRKFKTVLTSARGTVTEMKASDAIKDVEEARERARAAALAKLLEKSTPLAAAGDFDAALAVLRTAPPELATGVKTERRKLHFRAAIRLKSALEQAEKLSRQGKPLEGLAALDAIKSLRYAPWKARVVALRTRLEKEKLDVAATERKRQEAAARSQLEEVLDLADDLVARGRPVNAAEQLAAGRKKLNPQQQAAIARELTAAEAVFGSLVAQEKARKAALEKLLGTTTDIRTRTQRYRKCKITKLHPDGLSIEYEKRIMGVRSVMGMKVRFDQLAPGEMARLIPAVKPGTADEQVAAALVAMHAKRFPAAGEHLLAAGAHPLIARYRRKLDILKLGAVEAAAKDDWGRKVLTLSRPRLSLSGAKGMLAALDAFETRHGKTAFAGKVKTEAARLRALAETRIEASPEGMTHKIRKLFAGKVKSFDPRTRKIELFYDFEDHKQFGDWWSAAPGTRGEDKTMLHSTGERGYRLPPRLKAAVTIESVEFEVEVEEGTPNIWIWAQCGAIGSWYSRGLRISANNKYGEIFCDLKKKPWSRRVPAAITLRKRHKMRLLFGKGEVHWQIDGKKVGSMKYVQGGYYFGLGTYGVKSKAHFDNIRIVGNLHKPWVESAAALVGKPSPWRAVWREVKGRHSLSGYATTAFDTTRNRLVALNSELRVATYDLKADKWFELHKQMTQAQPGVPKVMTALNATYDPGADRLLVCGAGPALAFDMKTNRWSALTAGTFKGAAYPGMAFGVGAGLFLSGNHGNLSFLFEAKSGAKQWQKKKFTGTPYPRIYSGDILTYDSKRKQFFMFSGTRVNDTWTYDPAKSHWTRLWPGFSPPAKLRPSTCYDSGNDLVVMQASRRKSTSTWVFDRGRNSWFRLTPDRPGKAPRGRGYIEYDPVNKCCIVWDSGYGSGGVSILRIVPGTR